MLPSPATRSSAPAGYTLTELVVVLLLLAVLLGVAVPELRGLADRSAVVGGREALVALLAEARMAAVTRGGARVRIGRRPALAVVEAGGDSLSSVHLGERFGVELHLSRERSEAEIRFDALGLGRIASETVRLTRGRAEARVVISGYGRVRRP